MCTYVTTKTPEGTHEAGLQTNFYTGCIGAPALNLGAPNKKCI